MINRPFAESKYQKHRFIQLSKDKKYVQLSVTENVTFDNHIIKNKTAEKQLIHKKNFSYISGKESQINFYLQEPQCCER